MPGTRAGGADSCPAVETRNPVRQDVLVTQLPQAPSAPPASPKSDDAIYTQIANELGVKAWQVKAAVELLDGGSTVPFIARYRKEATGTLDDTQLRDLDERLRYLRELADRRRAVLEAIDAQGQLTPELKKAILAADTKSRLETSTSHSNPSGAPKRRLHGKPALNRWPRPC